MKTKMCDLESKLKSKNKKTKDDEMRKKKEKWKEKKELRLERLQKSRDKNKIRVLRFDEKNQSKKSCIRLKEYIMLALTSTGRGEVKSKLKRDPRQELITAKIALRGKNT